MKLVLSEDWTGTAAELAERLVALLNEYGLPADPVPNERLVRFYVTAGALTRPRKEGREARFGYRQVVEFLAVRVLLGDGWPLAKAAEYLARTDTTALRALLPQKTPAMPAPASPPGTKAEQLVARFKRSEVRVSADRKEAEEARPSAAPAVPPMEPDLPELAKRQSAKVALRELGHTDAGPERETWTRIEIAPGCEVHLRPVELERYRKEKTKTQETLVENLVRVFRAVIASEFARKGNR